MNAQNKLQNTYGWDVVLTCGQCKSTGLPRYEGWSPNLKTNLGGGVSIYAKIACPRCGGRLTDEAGKKLIEIFKDRDIPVKNRRILSRFITRLLLVPFVLAFVLFMGTQMDWWGWGFGSVWILLVSGISIPVFLISKKEQIGKLLLQCDCGKPHYVFMGSLDGAYCYRCFSCGSLMKLRE